MTFKAADDSRKLTLPKTPDEYKFEVTKNFQVPQGIEFKLDDKSPLLPQARALMHDIDQGKVGGQEAFSRLIELHAAGEVARIQAFDNAAKAEIQKLGANGTARVTAVQTWLKGMLGEDAAKHMSAMMVTAGHVEGFENLMKKFTSQGGSTYTPSREPNEPEKLTPEQRSKMSFQERLAYARRFPQQNQPSNGRA